MADESSDVSGSQHVLVILRYVDTRNEIHVYFMQSITLDQYDVKSLSDKLFEFLNELNFAVRNYITQCYDGICMPDGEDVFCTETFQSGWVSQDEADG
jgi:hypothetical protein